MGMSNRSLLRKATLTTTDMVASGVALTIEQATAFLRLAITPQVMLSDVRTVSHSAATWQEARIDFANRVMRPGIQGTRLAPQDRTEPATAMIELVSKLHRAEIPIADEVFEDNVEQQGFSDTVMTMTAEACGRDIEELMINGDTTSDDAWLAQYDGWLKQSQSGLVYDASEDGQDYKTIFINMVKKLPAKYKTDKANMRFYVPLQLDENYRTDLAERGSPLGDLLLQGEQPLVFQGIAIIPVPLIAIAEPDSTASIILTHRLNLYAGFHRAIKLETWRDPREGAMSIVVTARTDAKVGHSPAVVVANSVAV
jgi:hypothetical protein